MHEAEKERRRSEASGDLGPAIARILVESTTLAEATPKLLACIGEALGWQLGAIWEVDRDAQVLSCVDVWKAPGVSAHDFDELTRSVNFAPGVGLPGRVWASGKPASIADVTRDENFPRARAAADAGLHGAFAFPIATAKEVLGVVELFSREDREPDAEVLRVMTASAGQIGSFMERERADEGVRKRAALGAAMLESMLDAVIAIDHEGTIIEFNSAAEAAFGYDREEVMGGELAEVVIPPLLRERHRRGLARYLAGGEGAVLGKRVELSGMRSDGSEFPAELVVTRIGSDDPPLFMACIRDVSEPRRGQEALQFLVRASDALDESLDLDATLQTLARLTVPYLADGCMVDLLSERGYIERAASAAADPTYEPVLDELRRHRIDPDGPHPIAEVMRVGSARIVPDVSNSFRRDISADEDYYEALLRWPARSAVVAPMKIRGKVLGTLALASFSEERTWDAHDVSVIEELARRAANAVENARLFEERTRLARTLRESLLPPRLPELHGAEVAARFQPGTASEVSGDFYDVFGAGHAIWAITIGDVSGRGVEAAGTTALARHTIRAAAIQGASPGAILAVLNDALLSQPAELRLCSAVVGLLAIGSAGARLSLASGGHPPPLLLRADGSVEPVVGSGTLLGVIAEPDFGEAEVNLTAGDSVVFYTDGLTGARPNGRRRGVEDLVSVVESCVDLDATITAASIDHALLEPERGALRDDAAILVLRILESAGEDGYEPGPDDPASGERERWVKTRRLAWSRWAGRGDEPDRPPSSRAGQSGPRSAGESRTTATRGRRRSGAERS